MKRLTGPQPPHAMREFEAAELPRRRQTGVLGTVPLAYFDVSAGLSAGQASCVHVSDIEPRQSLTQTPHLLKCKDINSKAIDRSTWTNVMKLMFTIIPSVVQT